MIYSEMELKKGNLKEKPDIHKEKMKFSSSFLSPLQNF